MKLTIQFWHRDAFLIKENSIVYGAKWKEELL